MIDTKPLRRKLHKPEVEKEEKPVLAPETIREILARLPYAHRLFIVMMSVLTIRAGEAPSRRCSYSSALVASAKRRQAYPNIPAAVRVPALIP